MPQVKPDIPKRDRTSPDCNRENSQREKLQKMDINEMYTKLIEKIDGVKEEIKSEIKNEIDGVKKEIKLIDEKISKELTGIKKSLSALEIRISDLEQSNNKSTLIMTGLPPVKNNTTLAHFNIVLKKLGESAVENDFKRLSIIPYKSGVGSFIIADFWEERKKVTIIKKFKALIKEGKPLEVNKIFLVDNSALFNAKQIRIKNLLTKYKADLLKQAQTFRDKPFKYVWENDGRILVKEKDDSKAIEIKSVAQLTALATIETD